MANVIHEMSCLAHHSSAKFGRPLHSIFLKNPLVINHLAPRPDAQDQVHRFILSDGKQKFSVLIDDGVPQRRGWVAISPDGEFEGATIQSSEKARYLVRYDKSISQQGGKLAPQLLDEFVQKYDATDFRY